MYKNNLLLLCMALSFSVHAQDTALTFLSDKDCEVLLYKPIDGQYNNRFPYTRLVCTKDKPVTCKLEISSCAFLFCQFPQYSGSCDIIAFPKDSIQVSVNENGIEFQGNNATGQQYLFDNFKKEPFTGYFKMSEVFQEYVQRKRLLGSILPELNKLLRISEQVEEADQLPLKTSTSREFSEVLKRNISLFYDGFILMSFNGLLSEKSIPKAECTEIHHLMDSIFHTIPLEPELNKYSAGGLFINKYMSFYSQDKEWSEYETNTFGPYKTYLYAPKEMQAALLGNAYFIQLKYNSGEMNLPEVRAYMNKEFPQSEYTAIINKQATTEEATTGTVDFNKNIINTRIDSLIQLKEIPELQGKYLYIDLWASWCMPCRAEFSYKEQVHQILDSYKNVATVYISIDYDKQEKAWQNCIKHYKLGGLHLRASSALQKDIQKQVYGTDRYDIPRYVLISPTGAILHKDLPRPSDYPKLKETLDKLIKQ